MKAVIVTILCVMMAVVATYRAITTWNQPEYPYTGFQPDCPTWEP